MDDRNAHSAALLLATCALLAGACTAGAPLSEGEWSALAAPADASDAGGALDSDLWTPLDVPAGGTGTATGAVDAVPDVLADAPDPVSGVGSATPDSGTGDATGPAPDAMTPSLDAGVSEPADVAAETDSEPLEPLPSCGGRIKERWDEEHGWDFTPNAEIVDETLVLSPTDASATALLEAAAWDGGFELTVKLALPDSIPVGGIFWVQVYRPDSGRIAVSAQSSVTGEGVMFLPFEDNAPLQYPENAITSSLGIDVKIELDVREDEIALTVKEGKDTLGEVTLDVAGSGPFDRLEIGLFGDGVVVEVDEVQLKTCADAEELCETDDCEDVCDDGYCNPLLGCGGCE